MLTPTFLACFNSEDHSAINEEGFMVGESGPAPLDPYSTVGFQLNLYAIGRSVVDGACITMRTAGDAADESNPMLVKDAEGQCCLVLVCANAAIADGWLGAIQSQIPRALDITPPERTRPPIAAAAVSAKAGAPRPGAAAEGGGGDATAAPPPALMRQGSFLSRLGAALSGGGSASSDSTAPLFDDDYITYDPWTPRGIDLSAKASRKFLEDAEGHAAAILHGWLTKRNKSGLTSGKVDKDRYFVLTPYCLAFFTDDRTADVRDGYMFGRAEGERTGFLGRTGAALSLEAVCEVRLMSQGGGGGVFGDGRGTAAGDDADGDAGEEGRRRAAKKDDGRKRGDRGGREDAAADAGDDDRVPAPSAATRSTMFSVDFGDFSLMCNAHNQPCRVAWVSALRKWSAWRKRALDAEMLAHFGAR